MNYWLEFDETTVVPYLFNLDVSRAARVVMARFFNDLRSTADAYINDSTRRLAPGSEYFAVIFSFRDPDTKTRHRLRLIISDAAIQFGVLRIVYADGQSRP